MVKRLLLVFTTLFLLVPSMAFADAQKQEKRITFNGEIKREKHFKENSKRSNSVQKIKGDMSKTVLENKSKPLSNAKVDEFKNSLPKKKSALNSILSDKVRATTNDDPNRALPVEINGVYSDVITEENQIKWYAFESVSLGKLTVFLQTIDSLDIDYDLMLFKLNEETMALEEEGFSNYGAGLHEQVAAKSDGGIYFIAVYSSKGFDADTPFYFTIKHASTYDEHEIDDHPWMATPYLNTVNHSGTIDNTFDRDWIKLSVDETKTFDTFLKNSSPAQYQLDIYDSQLNYLAGFNEEEAYDKYVFAPGIYYLRVASVNSYDAVNKYNLTISESKNTASKANITMINSDGGVEGRVDYGGGRAWRIKNNITIHGTALDANNKPLRNAHIEFTITGELNKKDYKGEGLTDSNGNFSVSMYVGHAIGQFAYSAPVSTHYFDIIPIRAKSNGYNVQLSDTFLYHFAYSMR